MCTLLSGDSPWSRDLGTEKTTYFPPTPQIWKSNITYLNKPWVKEKSKKEVRKYFELNDN